MDRIAIRTWPWLLPLALSGFLLAVFGTYWDDAWHTEKGRDSFLAAPHVALYLGIATTGGALAAWALLAARVTGWRVALAHPPLALGLAGVAIALAGAPADNAWHEAFGRDAVVWSPPHMLGVAGTLAIASGLLLELARAPASRTERIAAVIAAGAVVAVGVIPVLEYETDVPQFDLAFYLPALATGAGFALGLARLALPLRWAAGAAALAYTAVMALVAVVLATVGMPAPLVPLLVLPAAVLDLAAPRLPRPLVAAAFALALYIVYVPYLNWVKNGVYVELSDVASGLPLAAVGSFIALALTAGTPRDRRLRRRPPVATAAVLVCLALPSPGLAHDPGQGDELARARIRVSAVNDRARLAVDLSGSSHCDDLTPGRVVARRAGETTRGPLRDAGTCGFVGEVALPDRGRWFVYAEFEHAGRAAETWLAVHADGGETVTDPSRSVYEPPAVSDPPVKVLAGVLIYAILLGTMAGIPIAYRRVLAPSAT